MPVAAHKLISIQCVPTHHGSGEVGAGQRGGVEDADQVWMGFREILKFVLDQKLRRERGELVEKPAQQGW